jgi:hypothetical protein
MIIYLFIYLVNLRFVSRIFFSVFRFFCRHGELPRARTPPPRTLGAVKSCVRQRPHKNFKGLAPGTYKRDRFSANVFR